MTDIQSSDARWYVPAAPVDKLIARLVGLQRLPVVGKLIYLLLMIRGTDIHPDVKIGPGFRLRHGGTGIVIHPRTTIGRNVTMYQGVTMGRADVYRREVAGGIEGFEIGDDSVICAGAVIASGRKDRLILAPGTVVGANSVLTKSTERGEIWVGVPAVCVGVRDDY